MVNDIKFGDLFRSMQSSTSIFQQLYFNGKPCTFWQAQNAMNLRKRVRQAEEFGELKRYVELNELDDVETIIIRRQICRLNLLWLFITYKEDLEWVFEELNMTLPTFEMLKMRYS